MVKSAIRGQGNASMAQAQPDPKAVAVADVLQKATGADCVVLFGSRARTDWTTGSDVDVMVLSDSMPDHTTILETQTHCSSNRRPNLRPYGNGGRYLFMTHRDFAQMSELTINHVAARARKEGMVMPRNPEGRGSMIDENYEQNEQLEYQERERRIADANVHYRNMHGLLDLGFEDKDTAFLAQQAVENAMKGLISALGDEYNTHHSTRAFGRDIRRLDPGGEWHFASNLGQLDNFAGAARYGPIITPIQDYREMANNVTDDLEKSTTGFAQSPAKTLGTYLRKEHPKRWNLDGDLLRE